MRNKEGVTNVVSSITVIALLIGTILTGEGGLKATEYEGTTEEVNIEGINEDVNDSGTETFSLLTIQNVGEYTPRTKQVTGHTTPDYDDGEFRGTLEKYVSSGSPSDTKTVTGQTSANYNKDGYTGTLTQYLESGLPSDTKHVTGQASENYNKDGYKGTLTQYVASGSYTPSHTKNVTGQTSQYYNSGGYTGTLSEYLAGGSASTSKYVTGQTSSYYNSGGYSGSLSSYSQLVQSADSKYIDGHTTSNYNSGGYTGTLSRYEYSTGRYPDETRTETATHNNTIMWVYTHNGTSWIPGPKENLNPAPSTISYSSGGFSGTLYHDRTDRISDTGNPSFGSIEGYKGLSVPRVSKYTAYYSGTVTKPGSTYTIYRYRGTVTRPAQYATRYQGYVYTPDTRYYRYRGDVTRPASDTRQYAYEGNVTRPDTRVYKYEGNVSKPDTREYAYQGTVYEIDKDAPEITFETDGNIVPNTTQSTVVNVRDIYTGVELSQYQWTTSPEFPEDGDWVQFNDGDTISKTENGKLETYYLHIVATDKEGNVAISTSKAFSIGRSKPETPQYKVSNKEYTNKNVIVEVFGVGETETAYYKKGSGDWEEYINPIEVTENTTITVKSIGLTGEESEEVIIDINNIDKTPPTVVTENLSKDWTTDDVTFSIHVNDEESGIGTVDTNSEIEGTIEEDVIRGGYIYTYTATVNGEYVFTVKDKSGNETEHTVNVTTIDRDAPEIEVEGNPTEYVEDDEVILTINTLDLGSGVKGITLPDGTEVNQDETSYVVRENGDYKFTVEDNVGNKEEFTIIVDKMMIEYFFYIHDSEGQPLEGAEFVLIRDGEDYATATSDENGLVHFGKVPPTGKYTIRQTKAPEGHIINPEEKEVDVDDDDTDRIEIINYPRGEELPATGTYGTILTWVTSIFGVLGVYDVTKRKKRIG